jgi:hypothetical protein
MNCKEGVLLFCLQTPFLHFCLCGLDHSDGLWLNAQHFEAIKTFNN